MEVRYLKKDEKNRTRDLYELCFPEDSEAFTDYYYTYKCTDNEIAVIEDGEKICSMIHLNPFRISLYGSVCTVHYIVAVATDPDYRRRGCMRDLMHRVFHDMYRREEPFTFLIPANPDYYYSSGFEYWENQIELKQESDGIWNGQQICAASDRECESMAEYSNRVLSKQFDLFVWKDQEYYKRLIREQESEDGQVVILKNIGGDINGIFMFDTECGVEIREPVMDHSCTEYIHPLMMGRILNLERFCGMIKSREPFSMEIEIRDTMIPENSGYFRITADCNGGKAERLHGFEPEISMDIAEFGSMIFDRMRIYVNEIV